MDNLQITQKHLADEKHLNGRGLFLSLAIYDFICSGKSTQAKEERFGDRRYHPFCLFGCLIEVSGVLSIT